MDWHNTYIDYDNECFIYCTQCAASNHSSFLVDMTDTVYAINECQNFRNILGKIRMYEYIQTVKSDISQPIGITISMCKCFDGMVQVNQDKNTVVRKSTSYHIVDSTIFLDSSLDALLPLHSVLYSSVILFKGSVYTNGNLTNMVMQLI